MTPLDKSYALLEQETLRLAVDAKDRANVETICYRLDKVKYLVGELQKQNYESRAEAAGMGGCCDG